MDMWVFGIALVIILGMVALVIAISKFHKCKDFTDVKNSYQYCKKCNRASLPIYQPCQHKWETLSDKKIISYNSLRKDEGTVTGHLYTLKCEHCGDLKEFKTDVRG